MARIAILLEDDPMSRSALELLLTDLGWEPVSALRAHEALALIADGAARVGAVITDFNLGDGVNGVEEARALSRAGIEAPVLVMSGSMRGRAELVARSAGHHYLSKPVLAQRVEKWLATLG